MEHQGITDSLHAVIVPDFDYAKQAAISNLYDAIKWEINALSGSAALLYEDTGVHAPERPSAQDSLSANCGAL